MKAKDDLDLMLHADGELAARDAEAVRTRLERDADARLKVEALGQVGELVRGHLELSIDDVPRARFDAMWSAIEAQTAPEVKAADAAGIGVWGRITGWLDRYRGHLITGALSAGAVAALALVLRPGAPDRVAPDDGARASRSLAIDVRPAAMRTAPEIEALDTPGGTGTVINIEDEDGHTAVIWVTAADTVEGI